MNLVRLELFGFWLVVQGFYGCVEENMFFLQEEINSFLKVIEEVNKKMLVVEISLEEKDQRIGELDRLIERMEKVIDIVLGFLFFAQIFLRFCSFFVRLFEGMSSF